MPERIDWNQRYASADAPWDSGQVSLELQRVVAEHSIAAAPGRDQRRALEVGCGTGTNAIWLSQQGFHVTAFDLATLAIESARKKTKAAGVEIELFVADLGRLPDVGRPFEFVFDRGVYHSVRDEMLVDYLAMMQRVTQPGSLALVLAGNANDPGPADKGPPRVHAHELCSELRPLFALVQLREFNFDGVVIEGQPVRPLGWSAMLRRR